MTIHVFGDKIYNGAGHNILVLSDILQNYSFSRSETRRYYQ